MRAVSTLVLPDPAPASTSNGPPAYSTASRWAALSRSGTLPVPGERDAGLEHRPFGRWLYVELTVVRAFDDTSRQGQADAPPTGLARHPGLEDLSADIRGIPGPVSRTRSTAQSASSVTAISISPPPPLSASTALRTKASTAHSIKTASPLTNGPADGAVTLIVIGVV